MTRYPAGVSGLVFFSNKEAHKRLSCVDSSYFHTLFFIVYYLLLQYITCRTLHVRYCMSYVACYISTHALTC